MSQEQSLKGAVRSICFGKRGDLRGTVAMEATFQKLPAEELSRFSSKPLNVFFREKKKNAGAVLPVSITGTYPTRRQRFR